MAANLYVHFPFCRSRCSYCSLYSRTGSTPAARAEYVEALRAELESLRTKFASPLPDPNSTLIDPIRPYQTLKTIYFGGGSPALCDLSPLRNILTTNSTLTDTNPTLTDSNSPLSDPHSTLNDPNSTLTDPNLFEFTVELHPLDVTPEKLDELKSIGVNRISMGVQSLDDATLARMGRGYTADDAARAFALVKSRFDNAGIDLIIGYPGDPTTENAEALLAPLANWGLRHCSVYSLQNERGLKGVPDDDTVLDGIRSAARFLKSIGLERYEISNYEAPGFECRHNLAVWRGEDYIGLGEGACGRVGLKRTRGILKNSASEEQETENSDQGKKRVIAYKTTEVSPSEDIKERTLFRLRTRDGIDSSRFPEWRPTLDRFVAEGLLVKVGESVYRLTERGTEVCDSILEELV